jgi:hypothetical protein
MAGAHRRIFLALAFGLASIPAPCQEGEENPDEGRQQEFLRRESSTVNGTVKLDSGMPPPEPVPVEILCEAGSVSQVYTDRKGRFTVLLGEASTAHMLDASAASPVASPVDVQAAYTPSSSHGLCQVRIFLSGYQPQIFELNDEGALGVVDVGTIVLTRTAGARGAAVSVTSYEAPKEARKLFESAFQDAHRKKPDWPKVLRRLETAVEIYPRYAAAWDLLGDSHLLAGSTPNARQAYEAAIGADADYLPPYAPLIRLAVMDGRWEDAERLAGERLRLAPGIEAAYFRALALYQLGSIEAAEHALDAARRSADAGRFPQIALVQADIHAAKGRFKSAAAEYAAFLQKAPESPARAEIEALLDGWRREGKLTD